MKVPSFGDAQVTSAAPQSKHCRFWPALFKVASSALSLGARSHKVASSKCWKLIDHKRPGLPLFNVLLGIAVSNLAPARQQSFQEETVDKDMLSANKIRRVRSLKQAYHTEYQQAQGPKVLNFSPAMAGTESTNRVDLEPLCLQ